MEDDKLYSLPEAAKLRKIGESTLRRAAIKGELAAVKIGQRTWAVTLGAVDDWLSAWRQAGHRPRKRKKSS